jgi:hypothetical protein
MLIQRSLAGGRPGVEPLARLGFQQMGAGGRKIHLQRAQD